MIASDRAGGGREPGVGAAGATHRVGAILGRTKGVGGEVGTIY